MKNIFSKHNQQVVHAVMLGSFLLVFTTVANSQTLDMTAGTLQQSQENGFLLEDSVNGAGLQRPDTAFESNGGNLVIGNQNTSYPQSLDPTFTFDFSFFVSAESTFALDTSWAATFMSSASSSISLLQGSNVVDSGVQTETFANGETDYSLSPVTLQPNTQYDLIATTMGFPSSDKDPGTGLLGQVPFNITAVPEPGTLPLLGIGLAICFGSVLKALRAKKLNK